MNYANHSRLLPTVTVLLILSLYATGLLATEPTGSLWADIAAASLTLAGAFAVSYITDRFDPGFHTMAPLLYLALVLINPDAVRLSVFHPTVLALTASTYFGILYFAQESSLRNAMMCNLALSIASICHPACAWLFGVFLLLNVRYAEEKLKFLAVSVFSFCTPLLVIYAVTLLLGGSQSAASLPAAFLRGILDVPEKSWSSPVLTFFRAAFTAVVTISASFEALQNIGHCSTLKYKAVIRTVAMLAPLAFFVTLFSPKIPSPLAPALSMPAAVLLEEGFSESSNRNNVNLIMTVYILLTLAERATYFI